MYLLWFFEGKKTTFLLVQKHAMTHENKVDAEKNINKSVTSLFEKSYNLFL